MPPRPGTKRSLPIHTVCVIAGIGASLLLAGCMMPLSTGPGLDKTDDYVSDKTLKQIRNDRLTVPQVQALIGEPTAITADGKAMGYLQCATQSVEFLDIAIVVPMFTHQAEEENCRQVGIWFDDNGLAVSTHSVNLDDRLKDCSLQLWLSNDGRHDCYDEPRDFKPEEEPTGPPAGASALVAPGTSSAGVASIKLGNKVLFDRVSSGYVDWHKMLRLEAGTYTISYYASHFATRPPVLRTDVLELKVGHRYQVGSEHCSGWSREHGCDFSLWSGNKDATYLWFQDVTAGQILAGSKTEPESLDP